MVTQSGFRKSGILAHSDKGSASALNMEVLEPEGAAVAEEKEEDEVEEDFCDCVDEPSRLNGASEQSSGVLEADQAGAEGISFSTGADGDSGGSVCGEEAAAAKEEDVELDEETLLEMERELSEEQREDKRKESTRLKEEGNQLFKKADYIAAEEVYSQALQTCPACYKTERSILFSNRAAARLSQDKNELALKDCTKAIDLNPDYIRALLRRAELYEKTDKLDEALADYKSVLERDVSCQKAREACMRLPRQIEQRNEKLKEEMISKLKDLGNLVLRPFGLSTENFKVNQDSNTGSYSINFVQNQNNNR